MLSKRFMRGSCLLLLLVGLVPECRAADEFNQFLKPLFARNCIKCHGEKKVKGKINLKEIATAKQFLGKPELIKELIEVIDAVDMPPEDEPQLSEVERVKLPKGEHRRDRERLRRPEALDNSQGTSLGSDEGLSSADSTWISRANISAIVPRGIMRAMWACGSSWGVSSAGALAPCSIHLRISAISAVFGGVPCPSGGMRKPASPVSTSSRKLFAGFPGTNPAPLSPPRFMAAAVSSRSFAFCFNPP